MAGPGARPHVPARATQRLDLWLVQARFFKSRGRVAGMLAAPGARVNGQPVSRPGTPVAAGDVLTFPQADRIRVVRVLALPARRGPAAEAAMHYQDLDAAAPRPLE